MRTSHKIPLTERNLKVSLRGHILSFGIETSFPLIQRFAVVRFKNSLISSELKTSPSLRSLNRVFKLVLMSLGSSSSVRGPSTQASSGTQTGQQHMGIQGNSASGRIKHVGPEPTRYVDFLACQGYVVEILGGKHFKTPEGEFVEMKSGTQYKIHVKNTHTYGKNSHMNLHCRHNSVYSLSFKRTRLLLEKGA